MSGRQLGGDLTPLERCRAVAATPIRRWHEWFPGRKPVGIYNAYVPVEMFRAAGLEPVYLFHQPEDRGYSRLHLPTFVCWPARSLVEQGLAGELDGLSGLALGQACDAVQALSDVWRCAVPGVPLYHVGAPANLEGSCARDYYRRELESLRRRLGELSDDALHRSIALTNRTRALVTLLYDVAGEMTPTELNVVLRAGLIMPAPEYNEILTTLLAERRSQEVARPRLILVGPHLADPVLYQVIEEAGAVVVDDMLDVGRRYYAGRVSEDGEPVTSLAEHYLQLLPTPAKCDSTRRRADHLTDQVSRLQAAGVIFARQKFCDPHGFDHVPLKNALDGRGIPHLLVELEQTSQAGQLRTRVEAFVEMLQP